MAGRNHVRNTNLGLFWSISLRWWRVHGAALVTLMLIYIHQKSWAIIRHRQNRWRSSGLPWSLINWLIWVFGDISSHGITSDQVQPIQENSDCAVANKEWLEAFFVSSMSHEFLHASDHMPLLLQIGKDNRLQRRVAWGFKFEEVWLLSKECEELVGEA